MKYSVVTVDATGKSPGRVASEAARILMGKHKSNYARDRDMGDAVEIMNAAAMKLSTKKLARTEFIRHTQHPGGLQRTTAIQYSPAEILRRAVYSMLPKNSLRRQMLKRLIIRQ